MDKIRIQKVGPEDIRELQKISRQTFFETFSAANSEENMNKYLDEGFADIKLKSELTNQNSEFYFAIRNNKIVGYLKVNLGPAQTELNSQKSIEIERIYVLKKHQGKKVGQILYNVALDIAIKNNADYIWLGVWEENIKAISFYKKNGFIEFDKHIFKLGNDEQIDIMMKLKLHY